MRTCGAATAWWALPLILVEARGAAQMAVAVARGRLLDHKGRRATFEFVLNELEESQRRLLLRRLEVERVVESDAKRQREVERMDRTINGTALEAACWGIDVRGRKSCLSYDEALAADAAAAVAPSQLHTLDSTASVRTPHTRTSFEL